MRRLIPLLMLAFAAAVFPAAASAKSTRCLPRSGSPLCYVWTAKVTFVADGDTVYADIDGDGTRAHKHIRITGLNAMEQTVYTSRASQRRGECHSVEATARLDQLLKAGKYKIRLLAIDPASRSNSRLRRSVQVKVRGRWIDVARTLVNEGHAIWLPNAREYAWNKEYSVLAGRAAVAQRNLWDSDYCGFGPNEGQPVQMLINWDADGNDDLDPNGEWVRIKNADPVNPLPLGGWWLRDSALRRYTFPSWAEIPPGGEVTLYDGIGDDNESEFYWGLRRPAFENVTRDEKSMGDGAYLFDPQGDLRYFSTYPCRESCGDPLRGSVKLTPVYKGREAVQITNVSAAPIDLEPYRLTSKPYGYSFDPGTVIGPGETMRVRLWETFKDDSRLIRYWNTSGPILNNGGDSVQLRRYDDVVMACEAWGTGSC